MRIGRVHEIWRFPVKSMGGEQVSSTTIGERGVHGDRLWAVRDVERDAITNAKRVPALLMCSARYVEEPAADVRPGTIPAVEITFPDGATARSSDPDIDARLSAFVGRAVSLCSLRDASDEDHYRGASSTPDELREVFALEDGEPIPDLSMLPPEILALDRFATPPGTYFDALPLHIVTTASLAAWDRRRFRANIVVTSAELPAYAENSWSGATLALGPTLTTFVDCPTPRCAMPTRAQYPDVPADKTVLRDIARDGERCLGAYASVTTPGVLRIGDEVTLAPPESSQLGEWARARAEGLKKQIRAAMAK